MARWARWVRPLAVPVVASVGSAACGPESAVATADASTDATSASTTGDASTSHATADESGTSDATTTDATDTDAIPSGGVRVLYVVNDEELGDALFLSTFDDGVASGPFAIEGPIPGRQFSGLDASPGGTAVTMRTLGPDPSRELFMPIDGGVPGAAVDSGVAPPSAEVRRHAFAPDGSGVLLWAIDARVQAFHHLPFDGAAIGAPVALGPDLGDQGLPREARYIGSDRVLLTIKTDPDAEGRELFVVAIDDPQALHPVDPDGQNVFGITSGDAIVYSRDYVDENESIPLFAAQLDGVEVAAMARIDDPMLARVHDASTSPNAAVVAYYAGDPKAVYVVALAGVSPGPSRLAVSADYAPFGFAAWSPDGAWLMCGADGGRALVRVADGNPGDVLVVPSAPDPIWSADSSQVYLVPGSTSDFVDLLAVALDGAPADPPYVLADAATYGAIQWVTESPTGGLALVAGDDADGQSLWYFAAPGEGATPVELTSAPLPADTIEDALFTGDGATVVVNRDGRLFAVELAHPGVEIEIAGPDVGSAILLP